MSISHRFAYEKPETMPDAIAALQRHGTGACVLAGGTDLICWLREEMATPPALIDIKGIPGLDQLSLENSVLSIGALVTFNDIIDSKCIDDFPLIRKMAMRVASNGVRNRATPAGNICSAVPCCGTGPVLLVYDAEVAVTGPDEDRMISIHDWFAGPRKTVLDPHEIVTSIRVSKPVRHSAGCWVKLGRYKGEDLAQASVAVLVLEGYEYRVAFGSVAPTPVRGKVIEELLNGAPLDEARIAEAVALLPTIISPITDIRASREYRMEMTGVMLERGLKAAVSRLAGEGPDYGESVIY